MVTVFEGKFLVVTKYTLLPNKPRYSTHNDTVLHEPLKIVLKSFKNSKITHTFKSTFCYAHQFVCVHK